LKTKTLEISETDEAFCKSISFPSQITVSIDHCMTRICLISFLSQHVNKSQKLDRLSFDIRKKASDLVTLLVGDQRKGNPTIT
jgi:hypothetical protein